MSLPKPSAYHLIVEHLSPTEPEAGRSPVIQQLAKVLGKTAGTPLEAANPRAEIAELMGNVTPIPWANIWLRNAGIKPQSDETCFVIEPVQMVASMNNIAMRPLPVALTEAQLEDLISVLQPVLASDSADIENINGQCLLRIRRALKVNTTPLDEARNRDLRDCLPSGDDSGWVRRTMTECQMVLHDLSAHPVLAGTGVNGVWLWGNTQGASDLLKQTQNQNRLVQLRTSDPWLTALMHHSNTHGYADPVGVWHGSTQTSGLAEILTKKVTELWNGKLSHLAISLWQDSEPGRIWYLKRHHLLRFWSRPVKIEG